ncbi:MAG: DNA repair exonuclease [Fimbriimonadales bacterium]|nr:DNA repair exonuclease [Fimbriimonadales bacterium]
MAIRLLHMADVHLGRAFGYLGERADEHRQRLLRAFEKAIETARLYECHAVLIAGDLFDTPRVARQWVDRVVDLLSAIRLPVLVIPGNHDPAEQHPFQGRTLPPNLRFLPRAERHELPALELSVVACPAGTAREWERLLVRELNGAPFQIALLHGSMPTPDGRGDLTPPMIARSQLDYIALGDWHSPQNFSAGGVACWYSGAPEMILPDQQLPGQVLIVELERGQPAQVRPIPVGSARYPDSGAEIAIDVAQFADSQGLVEAIRAQLTPETVAQVRLVGRWKGAEPLEPFEIQRRLQPFCLWLKVIPAFHGGDLQPTSPFEQVLAAVVAERKGQSGQSADLFDEAFHLGLYLLRGGRL